MNSTCSHHVPVISVFLVVVVEKVLYFSYCTKAALNSYKQLGEVNESFK